jgi:hypothetical protein
MDRSGQLLMKASRIGSLPLCGLPLSLRLAVFKLFDLGFVAPHLEISISFIANLTCAEFSPARVHIGVESMLCTVYNRLVTEPPMIRPLGVAHHDQ